MGVVAECTHLALNERVALKMLRHDVLLDHDAVQRFVREAQAAVKLKSEYVARVSDVGTFENGTPYMVMEFLEGHDLGELLRQRGVLPVAWACELVLQTAEGLAEAHSLGIVHRDVKPTNLFVTWRPDGSALIKVLDFGISKAPMGTDMQLTQTQSLLGTPAYMSPEQMRSARGVDSRSDIWSLGTVLYEILEGRRPFEAESFSEMCVKVAVDAPNPMVNTPPQLQQVILRCLAKAPEQRYPNMCELARDLVPFVADQHSASVLVERMRRMLQRSQVDWDGGTGSARQTLPPSARELRGTPARTPIARSNWGVGSDPAGPPYADGSAPFARVAQPLPGADTTFAVTRNRWPLVLAVLGVLAMTGTGAALYVSSRDDAQSQSAKTVPATVVPANTESPSPRGTPSIEPKAEPTTVELPRTDPAHQLSDPTIDPKPSDPRLVAAPDKRHLPGTAKPIKAAKPTGFSAKLPTGNGSKRPEMERASGRWGAGPDDLKKPVPAVRPPEEMVKDPNAQKPCDPFSSMHGCGSNSKQ